MFVQWYTLRINHFIKAPGTYDIQTHNGAFDAESVSRRQTKSAGWQQQKETENTAKRPHLLYMYVYGLCVMTSKSMQFHPKSQLARERARSDVSA